MFPNFKNQDLLSLENSALEFVEVQWGRSVPRFLRKDEKSSKTLRERPHLLKIVTTIKVAHLLRITVEILEHLLQHKLYFHCSTHITNQNPTKWSVLKLRPRNATFILLLWGNDKCKGGPKATDHPKTPLVALPSISWWTADLNLISTPFISKAYFRFSNQSRPDKPPKLNNAYNLLHCGSCICIRTRNKGKP